MTLLESDYVSSIIEILFITLINGFFSCAFIEIHMLSIPSIEIHKLFLPSIEKL